MREELKGFLCSFTKPIYVVSAVLLAVNLCLVLSILGVNLVPKGLSVMPLASTTHRVRNDITPDTDNPPSNWRTVRMRVTAYCPCPKCCGIYSDGFTASMHKIRHGDVFVAADKKYALGTNLIVPGYNHSKPVKILDRGGAIKGNRLDVFFATHSEALQWGVRHLDVKIQG